MMSISRTPSGIPSSYELRSFGDYALGEPYFSFFIFKFYQSEAALAEALVSGAVEAASGLSPATLAALPASGITRAQLNRVFGVFFNQNQSEVLRDLDVRKALSESIDRDQLVTQVLGGYATPLRGPVPPGTQGGSVPLPPRTGTSSPMEQAQQTLMRKGWVLGEDGVLTKTTGKGKTAKTTRLSFSLATGNVPELRAAAEYVRHTWKDLGAEVEVKIFDQGDLSQNVIRPRKYDALLFGEVVGRELDLFAFWHSSQRNDPGLNIALYANSTADKALEELRKTGDTQRRAELINKLVVELAKDTPAVFLYTPDFVYSIPNDIVGVNLGLIEAPSDRFLSVASWHRETDYVWPIFGR